MSGGIYLMRDDGELVEMNERGYDTEALLQGYLARHPDLLAGDQIDSVAPRRWLLVEQEASLASEEDGAARWSVDHLFLDQDAVPTIVEVKRSTDTRIRREVVGQMLDYAANGVSYWKVDVLRERFESNPDFETDFFDLLENPDAEPDEFWQRVERNLQAGRVRLVFVSDRIPEELRRIVEFLNEQMNPAEVLAVEIKQYVSEDSNLRTLVPRIIGQTTKAQDHKSGGTRRSRQWDETSFFEELESQVPEAVKPAKEIFEWATPITSRIAWGKGEQYGSFSPTLDHNGTAHRLLEVGTNGYLYIQLGDPEAHTLLGEQSKRSELLIRLEEIPGITLSIQPSKWWVKTLLAPLNDGTVLKQLLEVLDWFVQEVKAT